MTFKQWVEQVDNLVQMIVGCSVYDLPDCLFRDWYEDEVSPGTAAKRAVEEA